MSGQPLVNPLDADKFRREYLNTLQLRAELDDKNLQANKLHKRTGQTAQLDDYRTVTEKLADTNRLKIDINSQLSKITDGNQARGIVDQVEKDGNLVFLAQNLGEISERIKKLYPLGVLADAFMIFFNRYMDAVNSTAGVNIGIQQGSGENLLASIRLILDKSVSLKDIAQIKDILKRPMVSARTSASVKADIKSALGSMETGIKFLSRERELENQILSIGGKRNPEVLRDIQSLANNLSKNFPTSAQIRTWVNNIEKDIQLGNRNGVDGDISNLLGIITQDASYMEELTVMESLLNFIGAERPDRTDTFYKQRGEVDGLTRVKLAAYLSDLLENEEINDALRARSGKTVAEIKRLGVEPLKALILDADDDIRRILMIERFGRPSARGGADEVEGFGIKPSCCGGCEMRGTGLRQNKNTYVNTNAIDYDAGIAPTKKFKPFGRFLINNKKLGDDIVSVKRQSGTYMVDFPTQRVGKHLGKVLRTIAGNGLPSFEELNSLDESERAYLHKLSKSADIDDRLNIPAPKRDDDDKDIHKFEVMKGQILSGQDNKEMVKEFKMVLLRLSKKGLVPKAQVKDLLLDLTTMGY